MTEAAEHGRLKRLTSWPWFTSMVLSLWGGVVATEAVIEILPFRQRELHAATIRFHYWIDLLVELPLVLAVIATGSRALWILTDPVTPLHLVKIGLGGCCCRGQSLLHRGRGQTRTAAGERDDRRWAAVARFASCARVLRGRAPVRRLERPLSDSVSLSNGWVENSQHSGAVAAVPQKRAIAVGYRAG